jgi:hypothetical protein
MVTTFLIFFIAGVLVLWFLMIKPFTVRGPNGGLGYDNPRQLAYLLWAILVIWAAYYIELNYFVGGFIKT